MLTGLVASLPVIVSVVRALLSGWTPVFDEAAVATQAFDVLGSHSPLVGLYSDASVPSVGAVFSPGPMLFWLLAFQARFLGSWALPVTMGVVNTASIVGAVVLARRRGGRVLMFATAAALALLCRSFGEERLHDIINHSAALLPFTLLVFVAWSVACGEYRLLPLIALAASYTAQAHLTLGLPTLAALLVALGGLLVSRARPERPVSPVDRRRFRRSVLGAVLVVVVCWSAPVAQELFDTPGNLGRILDTAMASQPTLGIAAGWRAVVHTVGIPPWWLQSPAAPLRRLAELLVDPSAVARVSCFLVIVALASVAVAGVRRGRRELVAAVTLALALDAAVFLGAAAIPHTLAGVLATDRALLPASVAGMFTWLVLGATPLLWRSAADTSASRPFLARKRRAAPLLGLGIAAIAAILVATSEGSDSFPVYRAVRSMTSRLHVLPRGSVVLVDVALPGIQRWFVLQSAVVYELRRHGRRGVAPQDRDLDHLGGFYTLPQPYHKVVFIDSGATPLPRDSRVLYTGRLGSPIDVPVRLSLLTSLPSRVAGPGLDGP